MKDGKSLKLRIAAVKRSASPINSEELKTLLDKVYRERGADFRNYKKASIGRRVAKRLGPCNCATVAEYIAVLDDDPAEYDRLLSMLTIKVSEFFRDTEVFDALRAALHTLPDADSGIRAWCCGCASGEEPYSLAILLADFLLPSVLSRTAIFATDVDGPVIARARLAEYRADLLVNVPQAWKDKYFIMSSSLYLKVNYTIRNLVRFGILDIVKGHPISKVHILFCRNVFIYFNKELQEAVFRKLDYALRIGGILVLGKAEQVPQQWSHRYRAIDGEVNVFKKIS